MRLGMHACMLGGINNEYFRIATILYFHKTAIKQGYNGMVWYGMQLFLNKLLFPFI